MGPVSTPSSMRWTVTPWTRTPCSTARSTEWRPGNAGSSVGVDVDDAVGEDREELRRQEPQPARGDDEIDVAGEEPLGDAGLAALARAWAALGPPPEERRGHVCRRRGIRLGPVARHGHDLDLRHVEQRAEEVRPLAEQHADAQPPLRSAHRPILVDTAARRRESPTAPWTASRSATTGSTPPWRGCAKR
jgi:hypothetical protein